MGGWPVALLCLVSAVLGGIVGGALANRETWLSGHRRRLESRATLVWTPALALLLASPALASGLHPEDYMLRGLARSGASSQLRWLDLFSWHRPDAGALELAKSAGLAPWYAPAAQDVALGRPLASATHAFDFLLLDRWPWLMHLHSLLWFAAAVAGVAVLYRRILPSAVAAGLASLLYAVDYTHGWPAGWLANRNALIAAAFAFAALALHDARARSVDRPERSAWPAASLFALSLLGGEAGLCGFAYLGAHVLVLDQRPVRRRLLSIAPYALVLVGWVALYRALGFGSHSGSALYVDPVARPLAFLRVASVRLPSYVFMQVSGATFDAFTLSPWLWVSCGLAIAGFVLLAPVVLLRSREARFFALGSVLSMVPLCAAPAADRHLLFPALGAMALFAEILGLAIEPGRAAFSRAGAARALPAFAALAALPWAGVLLVHGVLSPLRAVIQSATVGAAAEALAARSDGLFAQGRRGEALTIVRGPDMLGCVFDVVLGHARRRARGPARCLSATPRSVEVVRPDERTLVLRPEGGFVEGDFNRVHWDDEQPMDRGHEVRLPFAEITVTDVNAAGEPTEAEFRFSGPLEAEKARWVVWREGAYQSFVLPKVGERTTIR